MTVAFPATLAQVPIQAIQTTVVAVPVEHRIVSVVRDTDQVINVLVEVETREGVTGVAYVAAFTRHTAAAICAMIAELDQVIRGQNAVDVGARWDQMWRACTLTGHVGISAFALSAIDMALWDLQGKLLGVPLHRLLGTRRHSVPAYGSNGCWLSDDPARVADEAVACADQGFSMVKVRFGRPDPERDLATLDVVRRAVGDHMGLIVDVNQGWTREQARRYGLRLADYAPTWLEEPLSAGDLDGLTDLRHTLPVPITAGENAYMPHGIRVLVERQAVSVVMPDVQRVGGVTGWLRASALAELWHVPMTSHLFPEISIHLLAASHTAGPLEWVTWAAPLLEEPLEVRGGAVEVPDRPGLGIRFDPDAVRRYRLD